MLTGKQRRHLRALGHDLSPIVQVGKGGVDDGLIKAVDQALTDHELIKLKIGESAALDRHEAAEAIAARTKSHVAQVLGNTVLLFRANPDDPQITLPAGVTTPVEIEEFGDYRVYEKLGGGGMATVHRAQRRDGAGPPVALKRLHPQLAQIDEFVAAFLDEAKLASLLRHDNIARTYDYGKVEDTYFIAMELVRGPTVAQIMNASWTARREIPLPIAMFIVVQLLDALEYAHYLTDANGKPLGIIHRDVTPSNVIVSTTGVSKLIDFGIAKAASSSVRTKTGFIKGKFAYVAPEYIAGKIDARVDLFAAGIVAHELLAGRKLFQVDNDFETLKRVQSLAIERPSKWNSKVPAALDDVVMTSLRRNPDERWARASAMRNAFATVAKPLPTPQQVTRWLDESTGPTPRSDASAVSIEINLIEEGYTKIGANVIQSERSRRTRMLALGIGTLIAFGCGLVAYFAFR